ncbi:MAG: acyl-CoA synthetase [Betaproteobacteria bacterium]
MNAALREVDQYPSLHGQFHWEVPADFNIAEVCGRRWAKQSPDAVAIIQETERAFEGGPVARCTYGELQAQANRLSHALTTAGVRRGDRVAVILPQRIETAVAHLALYQMGAVAMPLSILFGPEALEYRLQDSEAVAAIADETSLDVLLGVLPQCPTVRQVIAAGAVRAAPPPGCTAALLSWQSALAERPDRYTAVKTKADEAAVLIYTSGTTGPPKGALIPHRALIGNLSGFVCSQNWFPHVARDPHTGDQPPPVFWSPADWAWTGGLMDALLPTLYFGRTIVGYQGRFSADRAFEILQRHRVTHSFLFPTALKAMMKAQPKPRAHYRLHLRAIMSAGEAVGDAVFNWCQRALGVTVNEMFGQTEINYIVGNCTLSLDASGRVQAGWPARAGSMGRAYPGHRVAVIDEHGHECPRGTPGDVAVHRLDVHGRPDPVFFLGYWKREQATRDKYTGDPMDSWCRTGDTAIMDEEGYLWYQGRSDDMFKAAGYRIGPSEIENCLVKHPAVANAAVVPKPDAQRGAVVKAYIVLAAGHAPSAALVQALQHHVRGKLAPYEYPKDIEFIDSLPMTTTGKVQRRLLRLQEEERARAAGL